MAHELFDKRLVMRDGMGAWHGLGDVFGRDVQMTALEAFGMAPWDITLQPLTTTVVNPLSGAVTTMELAQRAIIRWPTPDDPEFRNFGIVGPEYDLISPYDFCQIFDEAVRMSITTYGALRKGEELFISIEMPGFEIKGDQYKNYLIVHSPWNALNAYRVFVAPVRVVCKNTLRMSMGLAGEMFKVRHTAKARAELSKWMAGIYQRASERTEGIEKVLTRFSEIRLDNATVDELIERAFPMPKRPQTVPDREVMAKRDERWEIAAQQVRRYKAQVKVLYEGKGWGMESDATAGTLNGFVQAVTEAQDWGPAKRGSTVAYDVLFGGRADYKVAAFDVAMAYAGL